jgi:hypothetical protein
MSEDIVRVLRILEYTGPRTVVEKEVERSIHGTKEIHQPGGLLTIRATTLGEWPEILNHKARVAAGYKDLEDFYPPEEGVQS